LQYGDTPLFLAAAIGHDEIVGLLVRANADVNAADKV
jgi:ankyrin repeat protein